MGDRVRYFNPFRPFQDPKQAELDLQATSYVIEKPCPGCAYPSKTDYYVEQLTVDAAPRAKLWRTLDKEGNVFPQSPYIWDEWNKEGDGAKRFLVYTGQSPCRLDQLNHLESAFRCLPSDVSDIYTTDQLRPYSAVYQKKEGERLEKAVQNQIERSARFYLRKTAAAFYNNPDPVMITQVLQYDREGKEESTLRVEYRNDMPFEKWRKYNVWTPEAQGAAGIPRPERPADEIWQADITDVAMDGMVDSVELKFSALGTFMRNPEFSVPVRTQYTAGVLSHFDILLKEMKPQRFVYRIPRDVYFREPVGKERPYTVIHMTEEKPCFLSGNSIATIHTTEGKTVDVVARAAACFKLDLTGYSLVELTPKNEEEMAKFLSKKTETEEKTDLAGPAWLAIMGALAFSL